MGKKTKTGLGRSLIKDRFSKRAPRQLDSLLHTADLNDGSDWGRLNLQSVTEESSFQEFLSTAQLAGTEFQAEKLNVNVVISKPTNGVITKEEMKAFEETKEEKKDLLQIPRRPIWDANTTPEQLQQAERDSFLEWRREMALLQDREGLLMTPYEKNLDFWRQLWRVVERSDVIVQILDARNPLLFRCDDLEKYVKELDSRKKNLLLINKSDFLNDKQRQTWYNYFCSKEIEAVFFSALNAAEELTTIEEVSSEKNSTSENDGSSDDESEDEKSQTEPTDDLEKNIGLNEENDVTNQLQDKLSLQSNEVDRKLDPWRLYGRDDLIDFFSKQLSDDEPRVTAGVVTIGLVGYPNVGKSSSINALIAGKKVSVSATPGKTKHFQTLYLTPKILLCDCPGLVFPSIVASKADMVLNGILPIDQLKDHTPSVGLLCSLIPRHVLEDRFSIMVYTAHDETPTEHVDPEEFLNAFAYSRGFMTQNGQPDNPRAARIILKEFVNGRLLYCKAPPGSIQNDHHEFQIIRQKPLALPSIPAQRATRVCTASSEDVDRVFFKKTPSKMHVQGTQKFGPIETTSDNQNEKGKPWKNHSVKRNKREKLRRLYHHLDLH